jgi:hypothetical protein
MIYDYDITIPAECMGMFRELLKAGMDALGEGEEKLYRFGKDLLSQVS